MIVRSVRVVLPVRNPAHGEDHLLELDAEDLQRVCVLLACGRLGVTDGPIWDPRRVDAASHMLPYLNSEWSCMWKDSSAVRMRIL